MNIKQQLIINTPTTPTTLMTIEAIIVKLKA